MALATDEQILRFIEDSEGATPDQVALNFAKGSEQHRFTSQINQMVATGRLIRTEQRVPTSAGGTARVLQVPSYKKRILSSFKKDVHKASIRTITLSQAKEIQKHCMNPHNRRLSTGERMNIIKNDMINGNFNPSSTIMFDKAGRLIDGNHRITCQVEAGVDQQYCVQVGCDYNWVHDTDIGKKRSLGDSLNMSLKDSDMYETLSLNKKFEGFLKHAILHKITNMDKLRDMPVLTGASLENRAMKEWVFDKDNQEVATDIVSLFQTIEDSKDLQIKDLAKTSAYKGHRAIVTALSEIVMLYGEGKTMEYINAVFGLNSNSCTTASSIKYNIDQLQNKLREKTTDAKLGELLTYVYLINGFKAMILDKKVDLKPSSKFLGRVVKGVIADFTPIYL